MTRYGWVGWLDGVDVTPPEPGKEWIEIGPFDDEGFVDGELCIIVLRTDASIFVDNPDRLARVRSEKEADAQMIVDALNVGKE